MEVSARSASGSVPSGVRDVVFTFFRETWNDAHTRGMARPPDRLLAALERDPRVAHVVVANPYRSWPIQFVKRATGRRDRSYPATESGSLLEPKRLRRRDPTSRAALLRSYRHYGDVLHDAIRTHGQAERPPAIITTNPFVAGFSELDWAHSVTYYARDDWAHHPDTAPWWPRIEEAYQRMAQRQARVCAVSQTLADRFPASAAWVVPNAVQSEEWMTVETPPPWFRDLPRPRLLYVGVIDSRLDVDALLKLSRSDVAGSIVLLGPLKDDRLRETLLERGNVHHRYSDRRSEIAAVVSAADVGLLPHRRTPLTEAMSPLKLYEYGAGGLPIVATSFEPVRSVRDLRDQMVLVAPGGDWVEAARSALATGRASERDRQRFIAANTWGERHEGLITIALR